MMNWETFSAEITPAITLLDVQGRRNPVLTPDRAEAAIALANQLQALGGTSRTATIDAEADAKPHGPCVLVYYRSNRGRATKGEIARVARIIARSEVRAPNSPLADGKTLYVTGSRAVVYPEAAPSGSESVVFLVSTRVWYNENRSIMSFPSGEAQEKLFLDDINARLTEGEVSLPR